MVEIPFIVVLDPVDSFEAQPDWAAARFVFPQAEQCPSIVRSQPSLNDTVDSGVETSASATGVTSKGAMLRVQHWMWKGPPNQLANRIGSAMTGILPPKRHGRHPAPDALTPFRTQG